MRTELSPCPVCLDGGKPEASKTENSASTLCSVYCKICGCSTRQYFVMPAAINAWNLLPRHPWLDRAAEACKDKRNLRALMQEVAGDGAVLPIGCCRESSIEGGAQYFWANSMYSESPDGKFTDPDELADAAWGFRMDHFAGVSKMIGDHIPDAGKMVPEPAQNQVNSVLGASDDHKKCADHIPDVGEGQYDWVAGRTFTKEEVERGILGIGKPGQPHTEADAGETGPESPVPTLADLAARVANLETVPESKSLLIWQLRTELSDAREGLALVNIRADVVDRRLEALEAEIDARMGQLPQPGPPGYVSAGTGPAVPVVQSLHSPSARSPGVQA